MRAEIKTVLDEFGFIHSLYTDPKFNNYKSFLVVWDSWYGGKSATEAIDESVFSVAKEHVHNRGSQHAGTVERKVKADWNWPHPIVAKKGIRGGILMFVFSIPDFSYQGTNHAQTLIFWQH